MSKPIEPGCLCLSFDSEWQGQCTANYFIAGGTFFPLSDGTWRRTIADGWSCEFPGHSLPVIVASSQLLRIDGDEHVSTVKDDEEVPA